MDRPVRPAYVIRTLFWARSHDGDDWIDIEEEAFRESLGEAISYATEQCSLPKTIQSKVYSTFNNELMFTKRED
jgi:hypothetical protein